MTLGAAICAPADLLEATRKERRAQAVGPVAVGLIDMPADGKGNRPPFGCVLLIWGQP